MGPCTMRRSMKSGAETLFANGRILTVDAAHPSASAVAVRDGRILALGDEAGVASRVGPDAVRTDLGGRTMVPGFIDAHNHMACTAETFFAVDASPRTVSSIEELVAEVAAAAERTPPDAWIRGFGMDWTRFADGRKPTRHDLDEASGDHPVVILHVSGHYALVNSRALADRGLTEAASDPSGGSLERDASGQLTGLLLDSATNLVLQTSVDICGHGPNITAIETDELARMIGEASRRYLAAGLTTICDPQVTSREMQAYRLARAAGELSVRTVMLPLSHQLDEYLAIGLVGPPLGDDHLRIAAMKFYTDGAITGGTAMFSQPMGSRGQYPGTLYHEPAELASLLRRAAGAGWQLAINTMGDRAMGIDADAVEAAMAACSMATSGIGSSMRPGPHPSSLARIARLGMVPVTQPARSPSSATSGATTWASGCTTPCRCATSWSWGSAPPSAATRSCRATGRSTRSRPPCSGSRPAASRWVPISASVWRRRWPPTRSTRRGRSTWRTGSARSRSASWPTSRSSTATCLPRRQPPSARSRSR